MDGLENAAILCFIVGVVCAVYSAFALGRRYGAYHATAQEYQRGYASGYEAGYTAGMEEAERGKSLHLLFQRLQRHMQALKASGFADHGTRVRLAAQREKWKGRGLHDRAYQRDAAW